MPEDSKLFILLGSLNAFCGVVLGAFGAHGLRDRLTPDMLAAWETGVEYHLFHALGLLAIGIMLRLLPRSRLLRPAGWALLIGILLFSGSLYLMAVTGFRPLGVITPFGGLAFLAGWLLLTIAALRTR